MFLRVQLTIFQHWFRLWLGAVQATSHYLSQWWLVYWRIYASLGLNNLICLSGHCHHHNNMSWHFDSLALWLFVQKVVNAYSKSIIKAHLVWHFERGIHQKQEDSPHKGPVMSKLFFLSWHYHVLFEVKCIENIPWKLHTVLFCFVLFCCGCIVSSCCPFY